ncbi:MAG TPA: hypothetical protein VLA99_11865 [Nitrospiraceae bacterium]|nr:hypothetical protein [Nitrospiraceae bacterium]
MSRYLQDLVMRSLGEVGGLIPRPLNRYEAARQGGAPELTGAIQTTEGTDVSLEYGRSFQDASPRTCPPMTDVGPTEDVVQPGRQTDAHPRKDHGGQSIEVKRPARRGISGERIDEIDVTEDDHAHAPRRPMDPTQVFRHSSAIRPVNHEVPLQERDGAVTQAVQVTVVSLERPGFSTSQKTEQLESLPGKRSGTDYPEAMERLRPSVRPQEVSSDSLWPTLGEVSFRPPHREETVPSVRERPPVVQIRIGRIEVRAVEQSAPAPSKKIVEPPRSSLPLDQYLRRRSREG